MDLDRLDDTSPISADERDAAMTLRRRIHDAVTAGVEVRPDLLDHLIVCVVAEGHVLLEDLPGVGKTTLARAVARAVDLQFARVQCTADLLPADVVGVNVFNQREDRFEFRPGPIFANVVLVDEINRASPKTQSGLLECMQERSVTVDVHTHELARPFLVLATQNPIEFEGTYPLPEAQVDRFMCRVSLGYPSAAGEVDMLRAHETGDRVEAIEPVATAAELLARAGRGAARPHLRRAAPVRRQPAAPHPAGPARRARGQPAGRPAAAARREGARAARRAATTRCPTTSRRWPRSCSRTGSCWRPRRTTPPPRR